MEKDTVDGDMLCSVLAQNAIYKVKWVTTGQEAMISMSQLVFDFIFLNPVLPDISGISFLQQVEQIILQPRHDRKPLVSTGQSR